MRTTADIVELYRREKADDMLGFTADALLGYLSAEQFAEFAKPDADLSDWDQDELTQDAVTERMRNYMEFAWGKALGHRGISASRSVAKMRAWLWVLADDELVTFAEADENYENYGAPILWRICENYDFPLPDDSRAKRMAHGEPCFAGCDEGCGQGLV